MTMTLSGTTGIVTPGGVSINGNPAFLVGKSANQTVTSLTVTKIVLDTETYDTAGCFNNTGSTVGGIPAYAFLPNVAGIYTFTAWFQTTATAMSYAYLSWYKNGAAVAYSPVPSTFSGTNAYGTVTVTMYLNGTTDYVEFYGRTNGTGTNTIDSVTYITGALLRSIP